MHCNTKLIWYCLERSCKDICYGQFPLILSYIFKNKVIGKTNICIILSCTLVIYWRQYFFQVQKYDMPATAPTSTVASATPSPSLPTPISATSMPSQAQQAVNSITPQLPALQQQPQAIPSIVSPVKAVLPPPQPQQPTIIRMSSPVVPQVSFIKNF